MVKEKRQISWKTDRQGTPQSQEEIYWRLRKKKKIMIWKQFGSKERKGDCIVYNAPNSAPLFFGGDGPFSAASVGQELAL